MQILRRHRLPVSGAWLAQQTGVSLRTIRRDVAILQSIGAEISGEPGIGYVLKPGFLLPPLMFSDEELQTLALGAQWVCGHTDDHLANSALDALAKIYAVLPKAPHTDMDREIFYVAPSPESKCSAANFTLLRRAIRNQLRTQITYRSSDSIVTTRMIWPFTLAHFGFYTYVAAWCEFRQDFRTFRIGRIDQIQVMSDRYPRSRKDLLRDWHIELTDKATGER